MGFKARDNRPMPGLKEHLDHIDACYSACAWVQERGFTNWRQAWFACTRVDWMDHLIFFDLPLSNALKNRLMKEAGYGGSPLTFDLESTDWTADDVRKLVTYSEVCDLIKAEWYHGRLP